MCVRLRAPCAAAGRPSTSDLRIAQRRFSEAEACYREAVGLGLDEVSVWFNLANMALGRNELDDAERFARAALRLQPNQAELVNLIDAIEQERLQKQDN